MTGISPRLRFALLYLAAWLPYGAISTLLLLLQRPDVPIGGAILAGVQAVVVGGGAGLVLRNLVQRAFARGWSRTRRASAFLAAALAFGATGVAATLLNLSAFAASSVRQQYVANSLGWDYFTQCVVGSLLIVLFAFLEMSRRVEHERALAARADELRVRAELQALRAQLDPHFLFNTLHCITALVRDDPGSAQAALERFASLMRYVLDANRGGRDEVSLDDELHFVRSFVALEQLRLGARLRFTEEIDEEALECAIPALTLQPLVENALRHGIAPRPGGGALRLAARVEGEQLYLEVADDGPGGDPRTPASGRGIGLGVVRQRLIARHGSAARVDVVTAHGEGWRVCCRLPAVTTSQAVEQAVIR